MKERKTVASTATESDCPKIFASVKIMTPMVPTAQVSAEPHSKRLSLIDEVESFPS
ncbi:unannotated protein [freshwater metagenome]|uniref:Unannotated protein n=1 Tax=freshwater metagenome TaxID=449393 RepID=A0A6J6ULN3_9ZZZZ